MKAEEQSGSEPLHVGIDLGTSQSAISSSGGGQFVVDSFVGWPADLVARKVLKRDLLIGRDALDNSDDARPAPSAGARSARGRLRS